MKKSILTDMQASNQTVHVIAESEAKPLIDAGYLRKATISPAPTDKNVAVNLTTLGRSYKAKPADPEPTSKGPVGK